MDAFESGEISNAISETWFRAIEKNLIEVTIKNLHASNTVKVPPFYPLPIKDSQNIKTWILGKDFTNDLITVDDEKYRVKAFHVVYLPDSEIQEDLAGLAIIHNGMKITSRHMETAPEEMKRHITGYIEFDQKLDRELRKGINQDPNHYELKWRNRIPRAIREYIRRELDEFGRQKLGLGIDPRERKKTIRTNAEDWALRQLLRFANDLDLFGAKGIRPLPPVLKDIGVSIRGFLFQDTLLAPRVNYGARFENFDIYCYNKRVANIAEVALLVQILQGNKTIFVLQNKQPFRLSIGTNQEFGPYSIEVSEKMFTEPGEYKVNASLFNSKTGDRIDSVARRFWVEKDPPLRQPFQIQGLPRFSPPHEYRQWLIENNDTPVFYYNTSHPAYLNVEDEETKQGDYLLGVMLEGAIYLVLDRPFDKGADFHPLNTEYVLGSEAQRVIEEIPRKAVLEISRYISEIRWRINEQGI